jgi:hypothetical protein
VHSLARGATVEEACHDAVRDLRALEGGLQGPVAIHAIDRRGGVCVVCTHPAGSEPAYLTWAKADGGANPMESRAKSV